MQLAIAGRICGGKQMWTVLTRADGVGPRAGAGGCGGRLEGRVTKTIVVHSERCAGCCIRHMRHHSPYSNFHTIHSSTVGLGIH